MASEGLAASFACVGIWRFMTTLLSLSAAYHSVRSVRWGGLFISSADDHKLKSANRRWFFRPQAIRAPNAAGGHDRTMFGEAGLGFGILDGTLERGNARGSRWRPFLTSASVHCAAGLVRRFPLPGISPRVSKSCRAQR